MFVHYITSLSSLCGHIWRYWTSKIFVRYILLNVSLGLNQFSQISSMQYMGQCMCIRLTHFSQDDCENTCTLSFFIKSEGWRICHCLWLGHETMLYAACLAFFLRSIFSSTFIIWTPSPGTAHGMAQSCGRFRENIGGNKATNVVHSSHDVSNVSYGWP